MFCITVKWQTKLSYVQFEKCMQLSLCGESLPYFFLFRVVHLQYLHPSLNLYALVYASSTKSQLTTLMIIVFRPG